MFSFLKRDPVKKLRGEYHKKLEAAMHAQRNGDIRSYSFLTQEAETIREKLEVAEAEAS